MNKLIVAALATLLTTGIAFAEPPVAGEGCEAKAVSKAGKPLAGAAKAAFMKKCGQENTTGDAPSAPAPATAKTNQQEKMKTCNKEATGKKGDERKQFMSECLKK